MRLFSTRESISNGDISLLAIIETIFAGTLLVAASIWFDPVKWLAGTSALAPLLLLRTERSVRYGKECYAWLTEEPRIWFGLTFVCFSLAVVAGCVASQGSGFAIAGYAAGILFACGAVACCVWYANPPSSFHVTYLSVVYALLLFPWLCFAIRFTATTVSALRYPWQTIIEIPTNWRRIVLASDSHVPLVYLPGEAAGPSDLLRDWRNEDLVWRTWSLTFFVLLFPLVAACRWSAKATCLIYLPLVWVVNTANFKPGSIRQAIQDYLDDDIQRVRRLLALMTIVALGFKFVFLWYATDAETWIHTISPSWVRKLAQEWNYFIVPHQVPLWQIAAGINGILALGLWRFARYVLRVNERGPSEATVLGVWRAATTLISILSLYTVSCTVLIAWKAGQLSSTLYRAWGMIGKQILP